MESNTIEYNRILPINRINYGIKLKCTNKALKYSKLHEYILEYNTTSKNMKSKELYEMEIKRKVEVDMQKNIPQSKTIIPALDEAP